MILGDKKVKAVTGFVLVESREHEYAESKTKGGIILPHKTKPNIWVRGKIHSAGRFAEYGENHKVIKTHDAVVSEGDEIFYKKYEGEKVAFADRVFYRLPYERVRMVVKSDDPLVLESMPGHVLIKLAPVKEREDSIMLSPDPKAYVKGIIESAGREINGQPTPVSNEDEILFSRLDGELIALDGITLFRLPYNKIELLA